jgi:hypothetical protein
MISGGTMRGYESLALRLKQWNQIPASVRLTGDDCGWRIAKAADKVVLAQIQSKIQASPYLSISIDDSDDSGKLEQCAIVVYLLFEGRRQAHLLKFHALPGADSCAEDLSREVLHVLCSDPAEETLRGEGYHIGGLTRSDFARRIVGLAGDGAPVVMGTQNGALKKIKDAMAPFAIGVWCHAHRVGLVGRDLEKNAHVDKTRRFVILLASDMRGSVQRVQRRLDVLREVLEAEVQILSCHAVRWLSLYRALRNVCMQIGPLAVYYGRRAESDAAAQGISMQLQQTDFLLVMHGVLGVLEVLQTLSTCLQRATSGIPDIVPAITSACASLNRQFIAEPDSTAANCPGSSCGPAFSQLVCNEQQGIAGNFKIRFLSGLDSRISEQLPEESSESEEYAVMEVATNVPEYFLLWHRRGNRRRHQDPTTKDCWDTLVAQARKDIASVAEHAIGCIEERIPLQTQHLLTASQFMTSGWWGLDGTMTDAERIEAVDGVDVEDLLAHLSRLGSLFCNEKEIAGQDEQVLKVPGLLSNQVFLADLDGVLGDGTRQLSSQLRDEAEALTHYIKQWPCSAMEGSVDGMMPYTEFWDSVLTDADSAFLEDCPNVAKLVQILSVMPHGSVENERAFSLLNYVKSDGRSKLSQVHLNAQARLRDQAKKIMAPYAAAWGEVCAECLVRPTST